MLTFSRSALLSFIESNPPDPIKYSDVVVSASSGRVLRSIPPDKVTPLIPPVDAEMVQLVQQHLHELSDIHGETMPHIIINKDSDVVSRMVNDFLFKFQKESKFDFMGFSNPTKKHCHMIALTQVLACILATTSITLSLKSPKYDHFMRMYVGGYHDGGVTSASLKTLLPRSGIYTDPRRWTKQQCAQETAW